MFSAAKARSTIKGIPFTITLGDILLPARCPVLGCVLEFGQGRATDFSPSLDRVIPEMGYVPGNVLVISNRANRIKNNATVQELTQVAAFYKKWVKKEWMKS